MNRGLGPPTPRRERQSLDLYGHACGDSSFGKKLGDFSKRHHVVVRGSNSGCQLHDADIALPGSNARTDVQISSSTNSIRPSTLCLD